MSYGSASRVASLSLSMLAAGAALAGVDLASSRDGGWVSAGRAAILNFAGGAGPDVNRVAKGDRGPVLPGAPDMTTITFQPRGLDDLLVVMRLPGGSAANTSRSGVGLTRPAASEMRRPMIACEPSVSPLAAAARNLAPGRCIT